METRLRCSGGKKRIPSPENHRIWPPVPQWGNYATREDRQACATRTSNVLNTRRTPRWRNIPHHVPGEHLGLALQACVRRYLRGDDTKKRVLVYFRLTREPHSSNSGNDAKTGLCVGNRRVLVKPISPDIIRVRFHLLHPERLTISEDS